MNSQEYRNLQEAYLDVYQEIDEATAMSKRGYDEAPIRKEIASKTGGGSFADKATKLADRETYGDKKKKEGRENLARKQRGDFRDTTSSSPGLRGYAYKATTDADKEKKAARGAQRGSAALTPNEKKQLNREELSLDERVLGQDPEMRRAGSKERKSGDKRLSPAAGKENANKMQRDIKFFDKLTKKNKIIPGMAHESYDLFDYIMEYLIAEGYADTNENALVIMANMSEDWRDSIVEGKSDQPLGIMHRFARGVKQKKGEKSEEKYGQDTEGNISGKYLKAQKSKRST